MPRQVSAAGWQLPTPLVMQPVNPLVSKACCHPLHTSLAHARNVADLRCIHATAIQTNRLHPPQFARSFRLLLSLFQRSAYAIFTSPVANNAVYIMPIVAYERQLIE